MQTPFTLDDSELYIKRFSPVCSFCRHFNIERSLKGKTRHCTAYDVSPIPDEIFDGQDDHREVRGDEDNPGIKFDPVTPPPAEN